MVRKVHWRWNIEIRLLYPHPNMSNVYLLVSLTSLLLPLQDRTLTEIGVKSMLPDCKKLPLVRKPLAPHKPEVLVLIAPG